MADDVDKLTPKEHRKRQAGPKANKKKTKKHEPSADRNPKAFSFNSYVKAARQFHRKQDVQTKRHHVPLVDRTPLEPPPYIVAVVGPPKVGKTTLINSLLKNFTRQHLSDVKGPITIVTGKKKRLTLVECNNDISSMIDIAKIADLVLLLIDASFGFEMEIFEFLNICQVHGFPKIMGVLTHLDLLRNNKSLKKIKKKLKNRFWTEVYQGAKLFNLSGLTFGSYPKMEVHNLGRFISVMRFRPLAWRTSHPYILADRMEDLTDPEQLRQNPKCDRKVSLYGYVRGAHLKHNSSVHLIGCGDYKLQDISLLPDPCPLPDKEKKRSLNEKEKLIYAPMAGVGGIVYDKDAVYINLGGSHAGKQQVEEQEEDISQEDARPGKELVSSLIDTKQTIDNKMATSQLALFKDGALLGPDEVMEEHNLPAEELVQELNGRMRRRAVFDDQEEDEDSDSDDDDDDEEEEDESGEDEEIVLNFDAHDQRNKKGIKRKLGEDKDVGLKEKLVFMGSDDEDKAPLFSQKQNSSERKNSLRSEQDADSLSDERSYKDNDSSESEPSEESDHASKKRKPKSNTAKVCESQTLQSKKKKKKKEVEQEIHETDSESEFESSVTRTKCKKSKKDKKKERRCKDDKTSKNSEKKRSLNNNKKDFKNEQEKLSKRSSKTTELEDSSEEENIASSGESDGMSDVDNEQEYEEDMEAEDDGGEEDEVQGGEEGPLKWKESLGQKAAEAFYKRQQSTPNLRRLVYGNVNLEPQESDSEDDNNDDVSLGGLFKMKTKKARNDVMHGRDCSLSVSAPLQDWGKQEVLQNIRDCFVTGKWKESEDAEKLLEQDDMLSDEELFGDFEDLETGEVYKQSEKEEAESEEDAMDGSDQEQEQQGQEEQKLTKEQRIQAKKRKKAAFDAQYDEGDETSYYDELKTQMNEQTQLNQAEFEDMDDETRAEYEGFRPGMYVRVELSAMPCEFVVNFDAKYPVILGGLLSGEDNTGFLQVRLKKHRWHRRILKTRDPLILSVGWRRFQTLPMYSVQDHNGRQRLLKYTPEHMHCVATMFGPISAPGTGILAIQNVTGVTSDFRVSATGSVLDLDKSVQLVKKLKLTGTPFKIFKNTAFIKGMFNSALEVAKFEGATIRTVSGIRGQIKRAVKAPEGSFRATFEDKILLSDIVFVRTWYPVDVPKFYNPVTSLLLPRDHKQSWQGMRTVGQLRKSLGVKVEVKKDSLYKPIERETRHFNPLKVPAKLQKELPFKSKPKQLIKRNKPSLATKRAVVMEPDEKKAYTLMKQLYTANKEKLRKRKEKMEEKRKLHRAETAKLNDKRQRRQKEEKKRIFRMMGQAEKRKRSAPR